MKRFEKILVVTVFLCIFPVANLFALSQEAQSAIEAIRAKLLAKENQQTVTDETEYVPGKELAAALERFRAKVHTGNVVAPVAAKAADAEAVEANSDSKAETVIETNADTQVIDQTENEAVAETTNEFPEEETSTIINEVVKEDIKKQNREALEAMRARLRERTKAAEATEKPVVAEEKQEEAIVEETKPVDEEPEMSQEHYVPGQLLERSVEKFRQKQNRETTEEKVNQAVEENEKQQIENPEPPKEAQDSHKVIEKANQEIEELFNNPEKRAEIAEKGRKQVEARKAVQKKQEKKVEKHKTKAKDDEDSDDSKQIDDERFNDYISRYNFKMPENYRIIVE